jgi:hypothetical protein
MPSTANRACAVRLSHDEPFLMSWKSTTRRLPSHGVLERESQGKGKPDLWRIQGWAAERYKAATKTSSEMSDLPL